MGIRLNNFHIGAIVFLCATALGCVTVLIALGKDTGDIITLINTISSVAAALLATLAASKSQGAHDVASDVRTNVNGRMTQLIQALENSVPKDATNVEVEDV